MTAPPKRRWFSFSLRTMFVVTALAAIPLGWLASEWQVVQHRKLVLARFEATTAIAPEGDFLHLAGETLFAADKTQRVGLLRTLLGDNAIAEIHLPATTAVDFAREAHYAFPEADINKQLPDNYVPPGRPSPQD